MRKLYLCLMFLVAIGGVSALANTNISPLADDLTIQEMIDQTLLVTV
ncbi:MAG: hypothetical protein LBT66_07315 [Methanobrevibacter sp.]|jgi:hypothetical protein|nr:hypothetical protein [Candidatus Methanovirga meridionalis]